MHLLQSPHWSAFKAQFGWQAQALMLPGGHHPTQVLYRQLPLGFKLAYIPKGPNINWQDPAIFTETLGKLKEIARRLPVIFLKIEPDIEASPDLTEQLEAAGFVIGKSVQPATTIIIDITAPEEDLLAAMKSKTRYNIRLAGRKGVTVRAGSLADIVAFYQLSQVTADRDQFAAHSLDYYQAVYNQFPPENRDLLLAEYEGQPLAGLMVFAWADRAYYLYGASSNQHRNVMAPYLLQWEAIKWAKQRGYLSYDLWGVPDASAETLEAEFANRQDGLWGVYRNKRGYGGNVVQSIGAFDYMPPGQIYKRLAYGLLTQFIERRNL